MRGVSHQPPGPRLVARLVGGDGAVVDAAAVASQDEGVELVEGAVLSETDAVALVYHPVVGVPGLGASVAERHVDAVAGAGAVHQGLAALGVLLPVVLPAPDLLPGGDPQRRAPVE